MERLNHLMLKHRELDSEIHEIERTKPEFLSSDQETHLHDLKKKKLKIKDEIAILQREIGLTSDLGVKKENV